MQLLTDEFISSYPDFPEEMNELGSFVFYRTYSRWLSDEGRRETWKETVRRSVEYNVGISVDVLKKNNLPVLFDKIQAEAEKLFDNIFHLRQFLSGRTHWVGGSKENVAEKFPLSNFNCSFINITSWEDLSQLFYLLLIGTGVGVRCTREMAKNIPPIRTNFKLIHSDYEPVPPIERFESTKFINLDNGYAKIYVGDSKEGWCEALTHFFNILTQPRYSSIHTIKISYNSIRPACERLKTFGGTASGHEALKEMFIGIEMVLKNKIDCYLDPIVDGQVRPIHILDICNLIGNNVIVGGVRRTAEIFLFDKDDTECLFAKYGINGIWDMEKHRSLGKSLDEIGIKPKWWDDCEYRSKLNHRRMSNNSICFEEKPDKEFLHLVFQLMQGEGEPGFVNLESAKKRRVNAEGLNPCAEVLLDSYGVCNLTTINVLSFVKQDEDAVPILDFQGLMEAQALSARAGIRMTCIDLEIDKWDDVQKRDRLIGCSITGWQDAMCLLGYDEQKQNNLLNLLAQVVFDVTQTYTFTLRIPFPLLRTTVKPEGTLSQVAGSVTSGLHYSYAPYYIRLIRVNANDPIAEVAKQLDWTVNPEVGTPGETFDEQMANARTLVIDFPIKSSSTITSKSLTAEEQLNIYFQFQENYTEHNSSNTITVSPDEWQGVEDIIFNRWDEFIGVSFLAKDGGSYELAPYEEITEKEYLSLKSKMKPFDPDLLNKLEVTEF